MSHPLQDNCPECDRRKVIFNIDDHNKSNNYTTWAFKKNWWKTLGLCNANHTVPTLWQLEYKAYWLSPHITVRFSGCCFTGTVTSSVPSRDSNVSELRNYISEVAYKLDGAWFSPFVKRIKLISVRGLVCSKFSQPLGQVWLGGQTFSCILAQLHTVLSSEPPWE